MNIILRDLNVERLDRLVHRDLRQKEGYFFAANLDWKNFELDYMPHKYFSVKRKGQDRSFIVHDTGTFFQCSFVRALDRWSIGSPEQIALIKKGKSQRSVFGALTEDTKEYNKLEIQLLQELMTTFRDVCYQLEIRPHKLVHRIFLLH